MKENSLKLSDSKQEKVLPKKSDKILYSVHVIRLALYAMILFGLLAYQLSRPFFIHLDFIFPVMSLFALLFLFYTIYLIFFEKLSKNKYINISLFVLDALAASYLIYYSGSKGSIFSFIYLLNIVMCGVAYNRKAAFSLAALTSIFFNFLFVLSPVSDGSMFFAVIANNFAFFVVAYLSGFLGEQMSLMRTEIKTQEQEIEKLEDLNQLIVNNVSSGLLTVSGFGEIQFANPKALKIFSAIKLNGVRVEEVLPGVFDQIKKQKKSEAQVQRLESKSKLANGDQQTIEVLVSDLKNQSSELPSYIFLLQDLTQIKRLEFAARQQEKLAAVGQLAAGIAHEIRNPLASISGSVQLLAGDDSSREENQKLMSIILKEIDRLNGLISEFLEFVRPDQLVEERIDVNALVEEVLAMLRVNIQLRREIKQSIDLGAKSMVSGDYGKLKQALLNISINSYQAMEKTEDPEFSIMTYDENSKLIILIKDNGVGMNEQLKNKMFDAFHTTKHSGTGLGLAVTNKIFENHNAKVFVESEEGVGTTFRIELPSVFEGDDKEIKVLKYA